MSIASHKNSERILIILVKYATQITENICAKTLDVMDQQITLLSLVLTAVNDFYIFVACHMADLHITAVFVPVSYTHLTLPTIYSV